MTAPATKGLRKPALRRVVRPEGDAETIECASSNVASVSYRGGDSALRVVFKSGATFDYLNVEPATWRALRDAASVGSFIASHVRGQHPEIKVEP